MKKPLHPVAAKLLQTGCSLLHGAHPFEMRLGKELVSIADHLLLHRLRQKILMRQWQILFFNLYHGNAGTGMALAHPGMLRISLLPKNISTKKTMAHIRILPITFDAGSIGKEDSYVMKHRRLEHKSSVEMQFGVSGNNLQRFLRHRLTMSDEDMLKGVILGIILI